MELIVIFLLILLALVLLIIAVAISRRKNEDLDSQYFNEEGDHLYYDRSLIRKKQFTSENPYDESFRTFHRIFQRDRFDS